MKSIKKLFMGAIFAIFGCAGIMLGSQLGFTVLARPWSFILGFMLGVLAGIGITALLFGFLEIRKERRLKCL